MKTKIGLEFEGKKFFIEVKRLSEFGKARGLMFRRREKSPILLFEFKKKVSFHLTSLFVFFPFLVLWLDKNNKIIGKKFVKPWRPTVLSSVKSYYKIVEIPLNTKYCRLIKIFSTGNKKI